MPDSLAIKLLFKSLSEGQIVVLVCMYSVSLTLFITSCVKSAGFPRKEKIKVMNLFFAASVLGMFFSFVTLFAMFRAYFTSFWPYFGAWFLWGVISGVIYNIFLKNLEGRIEKRNSMKDVRLHENKKTLNALLKEKEQFGTNVGLGS
jgi:hypothetical protein